MVSKTKRTLVITIIILLSLACGKLTVGVETPTPTSDPLEQIVQATLTAIANEQQSGPNFNDDISLRFTFPTKTNLPQSPGFPTSLSGLVYSDQEKTWIIDENGTAYQISDERFAKLSPFGTDILYISSMEDGEDIYLQNLISPDLPPMQLTYTPDIFERDVHWWPENPGVIVFNYIPEEELGPWSGYIGYLNIATGEYIKLGEPTASSSPFALSPDGKSILFENNANLYTYHLDRGFEAIDLSRFDIQSATQDSSKAKDEGYNFFKAFDWSPDSTKIAMYAGNKHTGDRAILTIDLHSNQVTMLHNFVDPIGASRGIPSIHWSPDGNWITAVAQGDVDHSQNGIVLWVMKSDGSQKQYFPYGDMPYWSPDSENIIYTQWPAPGEGNGSYQEDAHVTIIQIDTWKSTEIESLLGTTIEQWVSYP